MRQCAHRKRLVAVEEKPNHLAREWLDAVHVCNGAPRILLRRCLCLTRPTRLMFFHGLAMPFPLHIFLMLPKMGRGPEPNLGIGEITVPLAKRAHGYTKERVLEVNHENLPQRVVGSERRAAPLFMLHAVEHRFGFACTRQRDPRADDCHHFADGISALSVGIGCARAEAVGTVERDGLFRYVYVCVISRFALQCRRACM